MLRVFRRLKKSHFNSLNFSSSVSFLSVSRGEYNESGERRFLIVLFFLCKNTPRGRGEILHESAWNGIARKDSQRREWYAGLHDRKILFWQSCYTKETSIFLFFQLCRQFVDHNNKPNLLFLACCICHVCKLRKLAWTKCQTITIVGEEKYNPFAILFSLKIFQKFK